MIDPKQNLLTALLAGAIGVMGVVSIGQALVLGRVDVDRIAPSGETDIGDSQVNAPETGLADLNQYSAITERPVFFSDRRLPVVEVADVDDEPEIDLEADTEEESVEDLKARVAGIIITPALRMAMVHDESAGKTLVLREGMSLEGEQAGWRLDSIAPRLVNFVSVDGQQSELELQVNTAGLTAGSPGDIRRGGSEDDAAQEREQVEESAEQEEARSRAEEVRRRVAERRAELRAEAERRAREQQQQRDN